MSSEGKIRLDKWLWAARFFKTRTMAKAAIDGGKVRYNDQRCKPGRNVDIGAMLTVRQGWFDKVIEVVELSEHRKNATIAQTLYQETQDSIIKREQALLERKQSLGVQPIPLRRPSKKDRRKIHQFKSKNAEKP